MHQFDVVLKVLLRSSMARITGKRVIKWLETELPRVEKPSVDMLGETADGELMQIEVQSSNRLNMPFRMLRYLGLIVEIHKRVPKQVLLYVGREPLRMADNYTWEDGFIRYTVIDMHAVEGEPLLASPEASDNVLAILGRLKDQRSAVRSILEKISRLPREEAEELYQALLILAGLRNLERTVEEEARTMIAIDLSENKVLGPAYLRGREDGRDQGRAEGREEGREEGRAEGRDQGRGEGQHEGQLALVRRLIERKFGALPAVLDEKLSALPTQELEAIGVRLLDAKELSELLS